MKTFSTWVVAAVMATATAFAADEKASMTVTVLGVGEGVLEAKSGADTMRLVTPKKKKWLIRGLAKGDKVAVAYEKDGDRLILTKVEGDGMIVGTVAKIEKAFITVETDGGAKHRLMPKWVGGMPKDGGGHDKAVLKQIHAVKVGQKVKLTWTIEEGKRVTGVTALARERK